ncbi:MAG TPA: PTS fructose transporter subunit IIA, partial [Casimicrobium sp.]|nr:PTS fructose transporter subunit IIA [Casimicrobium sp.]
MIGILIIAHGNLGDSLIGCMTHVLGKKPDGIAAIQVAGTDSPRELLPSAQRMVAALDEGDGVLIIT